MPKRFITLTHEEIREAVAQWLNDHVTGVSDVDSADVTFEAKVNGLPAKITDLNVRIDSDLEI